MYNQDLEKTVEYLQWFYYLPEVENTILGIIKGAKYNSLSVSNILEKIKLELVEEFEDVYTRAPSLFKDINQFAFSYFIQVLLVFRNKHSSFSEIRHNFYIGDKLWDEAEKAVEYLLTKDEFMNTPNA